MDNYPSYIPDDVGVKKKYDKIYRNYRYKEAGIDRILKLFDLDEKSVNTGYYFSGPVNFDQLRYILTCMIITVRGDSGAAEINGTTCIEKMAKTVISFNRSEITKAIKFLYPKCQKYSLIFLVSSASTYIPPSLKQGELLGKIVSCPDDMLFLVDLMIYVEVKIPKNFTGIIPVASNSILDFEWIHHVLFGCTSEAFNEWLFERKMYLDINTGKKITESKINNYVNIDRSTRLVSSTNDIFSYSVKIVSRCMANLFFSELEEEKKDENNGKSRKGGKSENGKGEKEEGKEKERLKRKTIPKAIKNQLWRKNFGDSMKGNCFCCEGEINALEGWDASHWVPASKGGSDTLDNLRVCCSTCNKSMSNMDMGTYLRRYHGK